MTVAKDTAFHMAVHSKTDQPLRYLLERVEQIGDPTGANVFMTNDYENKLLVEKNYVKAEQLLKKNRSGQTPLFKAASFGSTKVVRYLASQPGRTTLDDNDNTKLEDAQRTRNDGISILHAAVRGEHFGIPTGRDNNDDANNIDDDDGYVKVGDNQKRKFAFELARKLIKNDNSWQLSLTEDPVKYFRSLALERKREITDRKTENSEQVISESAEKQEQTVIAVEDQVPETPLLAATRTGMIEIVREILKEHPQAVEHISHKKQNILHVTASYRQREVFELVKEMKIPTSRLILGIDDDSYTVLQHVADTVNYHGGTRYGPAYQLQEELEVATTMLAFTSTVILIIHLDKRRQWTLTLICCAAYFPVSVLALTHFPLFASFVNALNNLFMAVWEAPPCRLVVGCLASVSNSVRRLLPKKNSVLEKGKD
ncbi:hypothetical protein ACOSQ2_013147 [Xanthoceras sorbifolium]